MTKVFVGKCWSCFKDLEKFDYGRGDICPHCRRDTRVCKGCIHYEKGTHNDCRESSAERVVEKERSNFCDYFSPNINLSGLISPKDTLKAAADALFKKK